MNATRFVDRQVDRDVTSRDDARASMKAVDSVAENKMKANPAADDEQKARSLNRLINFSIVLSVLSAAVLVLHSRTLTGGPVPRTKGQQDALAATISNASLWAATISSTAFTIRLLFPKTQFDVPMAKGGLQAALQPALQVALFYFNWAYPTLMAQSFLFVLTAQSQVHLVVAAGGNKGQLRYAMAYGLVVVFFVLVPVSLHPCSWSPDPVFHLRHPSSGLPTGEEPLRPGPALTMMDFIFIRQKILSLRQVWPPGLAGSLAHAYNQLADVMFITCTIIISIFSLKAFKQRIQNRCLSIVVVALQLLDPIAAVITFNLVVNDPHKTNVRGQLVAAFLLYAYRFAVVPLALLLVLETTQEHEVAQWTALKDAERARQHAEEVAETRKSFLRYVFHEVSTYAQLCVYLG